MGMFDNIRCEMPLPDGWARREMQTKDFDCEMDLYRITADGRLERQAYDLEPDGPPGPHPFIKSWKNYQPMKRVNERWVEVQHHGDVFFYGYEDADNDAGFDWHEYRARFTEGRVTSLIVALRPNKVSAGLGDCEGYGTEQPVAESEGSRDGISLPQPPAGGEG